MDEAGESAALVVDQAGAVAVGIEDDGGATVGVVLGDALGGFGGELGGRVEGGGIGVGDALDIALVVVAQCPAGGFCAVLQLDDAGELGVGVVGVAHRGEWAGAGGLEFLSACQVRRGLGAVAGDVASGVVGGAGGELGLGDVFGRIPCPMPAGAGDAGGFDQCGARGGGGETGIELGAFDCFKSIIFLNFLPLTQG